MTEMTMWNENIPAETGIETFQNRAVARLADWADSASAAHRVAQNLVQSSFVPAQFKGKPMEATAAILSGLELGLQPMASLRAFDVIQGQAAPRAITLRAIVQSLGHEMKVKESTASRAIVEGRRKGDSEWQKVTWTMDRAKQLGLTGKDNWKKQPQAMLIARATSELARLIAADAILGIPYTLEEIADGLNETVAVDPAPVEGAPAVEGARVMRRAPRKAPAKAKPAEDPAPAAETEPEHEQAPDAQPEQVQTPEVGGCSPAQIKKIMALFGEVKTLRGLKEIPRKDRLKAYSQWAGRDISSTDALTKGEAAHVIDRLDNWIADLHAAEQDQGELVQGELIDDEVQS